MDMHMHSRLPRGLPDIHPDVVSVGRMRAPHELMGLAKKLENRGLLLRRHFEEVRDVTPRNRDDVARTQRMIVRTHVGQFVLEQDECRGAELAFPRLFHRCPLPCRIATAHSPTKSPAGDLTKLSVIGTNARKPPSSIDTTTRMLPSGSSSQRTWTSSCHERSL